jgi:hypothetical protein
MTSTFDTGTDAVHRAFLDLERKHGVFDLVKDGVPVWERVRFDVNRQIMRASGHIGQTDDAMTTSLAKRLKRTRFVVDSLTRRNPLCMTPRDVLVWGMARRKRHEDGTWWDIYCDPLYERLDIDYCHVEDPYLGEHKTPSRTKRLGYLDQTTLLSDLSDAIGRPRVRLALATRRTLDEVEASIESEFDVSVPVRSAVEDALRRRRVTKPLYDRLLDRINPRVVVVIKSYGKETFVEACRDRGIPTVELQHGALSEYHLGYSFPGFREKQSFPDYFFSFGDHFSQLADFPTPAENVLSVGYPHLETALAAHEADSSDEYIVFLSQGAIGEELSKVAVAVHESDALNREVVYKLHPAEYNRWRSDYPWLVEAGVHVVEEDPALYDLFASAGAQVGVYSTALYEGLAFGTATFLLDTDRIEFVKDLVESGYATVVKSADELVSALATSISAPSVDRTALFEPDPWEKVDRYLEQLVTSGTIEADSADAG